jgi:hypothetical protein
MSRGIGASLFNAMGGRLRVGKENLHVAPLVGVGLLVRFT